jgi:starch synthase
LNDTVIDANFAAVNAGVATGIACHEISVDGIIHAVERMVQLYAQPKIWQAMQTAGMTTDVGWANSAQLYQQLY